MNHPSLFVDNGHADKNSTIFTPISCYYIVFGSLSYLNRPNDVNIHFSNRDIPVENPLN